MTGSYCEISPRRIYFCQLRPLASEFFALFVSENVRKFWGVQKLGVTPHRDLFRYQTNLASRMPNTEHAQRRDNTIASKPIFSAPLPFPSPENVLLQQMESFLHLPPQNCEFVLSLPITTSRALQNTCRSACPALPIYSCGVLYRNWHGGGLYIVELPARPLLA